MKKQLLLSAFAIVFALHLNAQSYIGGVISVDTTLLFANSPYIVTNNLLVQQGKKVVVEPGVIFKFRQDIYLQVDGEFRAIGSDGALITFTKDSANGATSWGAIRFTDLSVDYNEGNGSGCIMSNCIVEYAFPDAIHITFCSPKITFSRLRNGAQGVNILEGSPTISFNKIYNLWWYSFYSNASNWPLIEGNEIYNCHGIYNDELAILQRTAFINNYIHDCDGVPVALVLNDSDIVVGNTFESFPGAVLLLNGGQGHIIKCNTFINNNTNMVITCERHPIAINNNFWNYQDWNIYWVYGDYYNFGTQECDVPDSSGVYATIDLGNNYWGGLTNTQMDASIWDFNDDFSLKALIAYTPTFPDSVNFSTADCSYPSVGINEVSAADDDVIEIYPNPFHDMSYIKVKSIVLNEKYKVFIFDSYGRMVRQIQVTNPERIEVSRDGMASGLYGYQLISPEKKVYSGKFIVE